MWDRVVAGISSAAEKLSGVADMRSRRSRLPMVNPMVRTRPEPVSALLFEAFAKLDADKDGSVNQDQTWVFFISLCTRARSLLGAAYDVDRWRSAKDAVEEALLALPRYELGLTEWERVLSDADVADDLLLQLLEAEVPLIQ
jgi:hypothetical protein